jgi:hypothetical protein
MGVPAEPQASFCEGGHLDWTVLDRDMEAAKEKHPYFLRLANAI